jgi:hypothetical protein
MFNVKEAKSNLQFSKYAIFWTRSESSWPGNKSTVSEISTQVYVQP